MSTFSGLVRAGRRSTAGAIEATGNEGIEARTEDATEARTEEATEARTEIEVVATRESGLE